MNVQRIVIPYVPRPAQREQQARLRRFNVLVDHRRFGKTVMAVNRLIRKAATCPLPSPRTAYVAPYLKQAKSVAWDYLKHYSSVIPGTYINNSELFVELPNGGRVSLIGADHPDRARGIYLDDCVMDEVAQMSPAMFSEVIRPALVDRKGGCTFIGTPKGKGGFYRLYNKAVELMAEPDSEWFADLKRASETNIIDPVELAKIQKEMSKPEYEQEFECSWSAAIKGAYWGEEMALAEKENRITAVPLVADYPVYTCWDLGLGDALIIWFFQVINGQFRFIDCREYHQGLPDVCADVMTAYKNYAEHIFPHDINVGELGSGVKRWDTVRKLLTSGTCVVARNIPRRDGIEAVRMTIGRMVFDKAKCETGIDALTLYRAEYDDIYNIMNANPLHDWTSHYADSMRYGIVRIGGYGSVRDGDQYRRQQKQGRQGELYA